MRDFIFLDCAVEGAERAAEWAEAALTRVGMDGVEAAGAAGRLAEGIRVAAEAFACKAGPQAMLVLTDETGGLSFELVADGDPPRGAARACSATAWQAAERRVAGDGAFRLTMSACA